MRALARLSRKPSRPGRSRPRRDTLRQKQRPPSNLPVGRESSRSCRSSVECEAEYAHGGTKRDGWKTLHAELMLPSYSWLAQRVACADSVLVIAPAARLALLSA